MVPENNPFLERHELDQLIRNQKNEAAFIIIDTPLKESIIEEEAIEKDLKTLRKPSKAIDSDLEEEFNRPLVGGSKGGILEDWMINSLLPMESTWNNEGIKEKLGDIERNYEGIKEKGIESDYRIKNEEISKENEKKEEIHKIKEEIEEIFKENNNNSLCINNTNEQNARYKFKMNRFLENKHLRSLLKARKNDKKRDLKEKIEKVFKKNKVSKDFFIDARVIDSIMKNIRKISNILKKY